MQVFAAAKASLVIIRVSMIPVKAAFFLGHFYPWQLWRESQRKITFIPYTDNLLFAIRRENHSVKEIFQKVNKNTFLSFERWNFIVFKKFAKQFLSRMV